MNGPELRLLIPGRRVIRAPISEANAAHVAATLKAWLPEIVAHDGRVAVVIEKDGVSHVVVAVRREP